VGGHGGGGGSGYASANTALVTGASGSVGTQAGDGQITFVPNEGPVPPPPAPVACANGIDDDHDGFKDADDPQCKLNRGAEGPVDNPLIACTDNDIVLINVARVGCRRPQLPGKEDGDLRRRHEGRRCGRRVRRVVCGARSRPERQEGAHDPLPGAPGPAPFACAQARGT
jgi:hypothetical protein